MKYQKLKVPDFWLTFFHVKIKKMLKVYWNELENNIFLPLITALLGDYEFKSMKIYLEMF
jgi:hypothetical protein